LFPRIVTEDEVVNLENPSTSEEILEVLKGFTKDKSPGPNGWTVDFFEFVGRDLLDVLEETRLRGEVTRPNNSNFLALIPKVNSPVTFSDFCPISLFNLCYKIIAKVITKIIRPILSRALFEEQLGFLKGR
jgi:hypothetical protein